MGLIGGIARTAVVAGTATAVSNNVSRRQQRRWAGQEYEQQQYQQYQTPPPQYAPAAAASQGDDLTERLDRLAAMRQQGELTDEEYAAAKAKLLKM